MADADNKYISCTMQTGRTTLNYVTQKMNTVIQFKNILSNNTCMLHMKLVDMCMYDCTWKYLKNPVPQENKCTIVPGIIKCPFMLPYVQLCSS